MKILEINNIGKASLNTDIKPWDLPPEHTTFGFNFKTVNNFLSSTNAFEVWTTPPVNFKSGHVLAVDTPLSSFWISAGETAVYVWDGAVWTDISSTEGYGSLGSGDEFLWTSTHLGSIPIINNPQAYPEYWSPQINSQKMQRLAFSPTQTWQAAGKSFKVIRSYNNFLFALNLTEGGVDLPNSYRWSHPADINGLPFTWDETDLSAIASIEQILGDAGSIVDGLTLRNSFCIYSERGINVLDFVGGEFVFRNRELSSTYGLLNANSLVEVEGVHYFLSDGDIYVNDGNSVKSILYGRIRNRFNSQVNVDRFGRSFAVLSKAAKEIWFVIPEGVSETPNIAYIYNWLENTWGIKGIADNIAFADYGAITEAPITWDNVTGTNDSTELTWGSQSETPLNQTVIGTSNLDSSLVIINPLSNNGSVPLNSRIERTDIPVDGHHIVTTLTRVYPLMSGSSDVSFQFGSQEYAGAPVNWKPAYIFNPSTQRKIDIRTTGELHAWRLDSIGSGSYSISGLIFEYAISGER